MEKKREGNEKSTRPLAEDLNDITRRLSADESMESSLRAYTKLLEMRRKEAEESNMRKVGQKPCTESASEETVYRKRKHPSTKQGKGLGGTGLEVNEEAGGDDSVSLDIPITQKDIESVSTVSEALTIIEHLSKLQQLCKEDDKLIKHILGSSDSKEDLLNAIEVRINEVTQLEVLSQIASDHLVALHSSVDVSKEENDLKELETELVMLDEDMSFYRQPFSLSEEQKLQQMKLKVPLRRMYYNQQHQLHTQQGQLALARLREKEKVIGELKREIEEKKKGKQVTEDLNIAAMTAEEKQKVSAILGKLPSNPINLTGLRLSHLLRYAEEVLKQTDEIDVSEEEIESKDRMSPNTLLEHDLKHQQKVLIRERLYTDTLAELCVQINRLRMTDPSLELDFKPTEALNEWLETAPGDLEFLNVAGESGTTPHGENESFPEVNVSSSEVEHLVEGEQKSQDSDNSNIVDEEAVEVSESDATEKDTSQKTIIDIGPCVKTCMKYWEYVNKRTHFQYLLKKMENFSTEYKEYVTKQRQEDYLKQGTELLTAVDEDYISLVKGDYTSDRMLLTKHFEKTSNYPEIDDSHLPVIDLIPKELLTKYISAVEKCNEVKDIHTTVHTFTEDDKRACGFDACPERERFKLELDYMKQKREKCNKLWNEHFTLSNEFASDLQDHLRSEETLQYFDEHIHDPGFDYGTPLTELIVNYVDAFRGSKEAESRLSDLRDGMLYAGQDESAICHRALNGQFEFEDNLEMVAGLLMADLEETVVYYRKRQDPSQKVDVEGGKHETQSKSPGKKVVTEESEKHEKAADINIGVVGDTPDAVAGSGSLGAGDEQSIQGRFKCSDEIRSDINKCQLYLTANIHVEAAQQLLRYKTQFLNDLKTFSAEEVKEKTKDLATIVDDLKVVQHVDFPIYKQSRTNLIRHHFEHRGDDKSLAAEQLKLIVPPTIFTNYAEAMKVLREVPDYGAVEDFTELDKINTGWFDSTPSVRRQIEKQYLQKRKPKILNNLWENHMARLAILYQDICDFTMYEFDDIAALPPERFKHFEWLTYDKVEEYRQLMSEHRKALSQYNEKKTKEQLKVTMQTLANLNKLRAALPIALLSEIEDNYRAIVHGVIPMPDGSSTKGTKGITSKAVPGKRSLVEIK